MLHWASEIGVVASGCSMLSPLTATTASRANSRPLDECMVEILTSGFPPSVRSSEKLIVMSRKAPSTALRSCRVLAVMPIDENATPSSSQC
jgi:hypothetical protein